MKKNNRNRQTLANIMLFTLAAVLVNGCAEEAPPSAPPTTTGTPANTSVAEPVSRPTAPTRAERLERLRGKLIKPDPTNTSPYQIQLGLDENIDGTIIGDRPDLDLDFVNQDNLPRNLATAYPGKILVIATIFTSCEKENMCPRLTADFSELASAIPVDLRDEVQLILVSFDPQRDTPAVLKAYGRQYLIDFEITDLLCGPITSTQPLLEEALQIPLEVNPETNMIVTHAMMLHIIDRNGYIVVERTVADSTPMEIIAEEIIRAALLPFDPDKVPAIDNDDDDDTGSDAGGDAGGDDAG